MIPSSAPDDYECPLCGIISGKEPTGLLSSPDDLVYSDDQTYAMVSAYQWPKNPGNVVVIPVQHFESIYELPTEVACRVQEVAKAVALAMKAAWQCDGISTRQHNEPAGNQDVWHYHLHVTPRYMGDDLYATYATHKALMQPEERAKYAAELRAQLDGPNLGAA